MPRQMRGKYAQLNGYTEKEGFMQHRILVSDTSVHLTDLEVVIHKFAGLEERHCMVLNMKNMSR